MKRNVFLALAVGLIVGASATALAMKSSSVQNKTPSQTMTGMNMLSHDNLSMSDMANEMKVVTGDAFDKAFLAEMIDHHQGAVEMAKMAQFQAKHQETKTLAGDIIATQMKEIAQMQDWQKQWGY